MKLLIPYVLAPEEVEIMLDGKLYRFVAASNTALWEQLIQILRREVIRVKGPTIHVIKPDDYSGTT